MYSPRNSISSESSDDKTLHLQNISEQNMASKDESSNSGLNHNAAVMNSIGSECNTLKHSYDSCFNAWFTDKFLKGDRDLSSCDPLLKMYTECVKKAMERKNIDLKEVDQEFLGTANENTKP